MPGPRSSDPHAPSAAPASPGQPRGARPGYLDAVGATPLSPAARQALAACLADGWADPDGLHSESRRARLLLEAAHQSFADALGCYADEVSFLPTRSDAATRAVTGVRAGRRRVGATVVHSAVEHSTVFAAAGEDATVVPVDSHGVIDLRTWALAVAEPGVAIAALQVANAEVGSCQPIDAAAQLARASDVPMLVDASHALGAVAPPRDWDVLVADAATWGGPGGVAVLGVRRHVRWPRTRAPRVAVSLAVASAVALEEAVASADARAGKATRQIERVRVEVARRVPDVEVLGHPVNRLPHVLTFSCLYVDGESLVTALDLAGYAVASGSACVTDDARAASPSHVLAAMGALTHGNVRLSVLPDTSDETIEAFLDDLAPIVAELRGRTGATSL